MAETKPAKRKALKMPKAIGACVDLYRELRDQRLEAYKGVEAMKADEIAVADHIIDNVDKSSAGVFGKLFKARVIEEPVYQVEEWNKLYAHIKKTGNFQLLNRALNQAAVKEIVAAQERPSGKRGENWKPKLPPGVVTFWAKKLSVTKI